MRAVLQRVSRASVSVEGKTVASIEKGLLVLVGFGREDTEAVLEPAVEKILQLRIFADSEGKMNCSTLDLGSSVLLVSQFTLYADCSRGRRPDFFNAAMPVKASKLFDMLVSRFKSRGLHVESGIFAADMQVELVNDGPVTISLEF